MSDGAGNTEGPFSATPDFEAYGTITPRLGGERMLAGRMEGRNFVNICLRFSANAAQVTTDWMAKDMASGDAYNIRSIIDPKQTRHELEMLCEKGVAV